MACPGKKQNSRRKVVEFRTSFGSIPQEKWIRFAPEFDPFRTRILKIIP